MSDPAGSRAQASRLTWILVGVGATLVAAFVLTEPYAQARRLLVARGSGWFAACALLASLTTSPLATAGQRFGKRSTGWLSALRRSLGIAAASGAALHAVYALCMIDGIWQLLFDAAWLRSGLAALLALLALLLTSFDGLLARRHLRFWKELHRLVYPATGLLLLHVVLGPLGTPRQELTLTVALTSSIVLRLGLGKLARQKRDR